MPEYQFQIHLDSRFRRYSAERCINMIMFIEVTQLRVKLEVFWGELGVFWARFPYQSTSKLLRTE
jgi:hypothetical protein